MPILRPRLFDRRQRIRPNGHRRRSRFSYCRRRACNNSDFGQRLLGITLQTTLSALAAECARCSETVNVQTGSMVTCNVSAFESYGELFNERVVRPQKTNSREYGFINSRTRFSRSRLQAVAVFCHAKRPKFDFRFSYRVCTSVHKNTRTRAYRY